MTAAAYWAQYLSATGQQEGSAAFSGELCFEDDGAVGMTQLSLVLAGRKTALFSAFEAYAINREPLPASGEVYLVEDRNGTPRCIIELTAVQVLPFGEVSWEMARQEGEDESLAAWQDKQRAYLQEEADLCGFTFSDSTRVVFEAFRVIYR